MENITELFTHSVHDWLPRFNQDTVNNGSLYYYSDENYVSERNTNAWWITLIGVSVLGFFLNFISFCAILNIEQRESVHLKFIISLTMSDALIDVFFFTEYVIYIVAPSVVDFCLYLFGRDFLQVLVTLSLSNLLVMGVDHYIAVLRPLHYKDNMTSFRVKLIILIIWVVSFCSGTLDVIAAEINQIHQERRETYLPWEVYESRANAYCARVLQDNFYPLRVAFGLALFGLLALAFLYGRVFLEFRKFLQRRQTILPDKMHNRKAVVTTFLIMGTFMLFWIPIGTFWTIGLQIENFNEISNILFLLNTICDPILYGIRLPIVRKGYKRFFGKFVKRHPSESYSFRTEETDINHV